MSHLWFVIAMALLVSGATVLPGNRPAAERLGAAVYTLVSCLFAVFAGGWLMFAIHG